MTSYRRNRIVGATYFFTVNLADRRSDLLVRHIESLRAAIRSTITQAPFHIDGWVVLPNHMHCLWTLPAGDANFSARWRDIKKCFAKQMPRGEARSSSRIGKNERGVWQRRFWEHTIRDGADYANHLDYIHFNPVKHRLVTSAADWPFSTFRRCVAAGLYPPDWAGPAA